MAVYIIAAGDTGKVKIGSSNSMNSRIRKMQVDNPEKLTVLRIIEGGTEKETALHKRFAKQRIHGDWFFFDPSMMAENIEEEAMLDVDSSLVEQLIKDPEQPPVIEIHDAIIRALGGATRLASIPGFGAKRNAISNWPRYGIPGRFWPTLVKLAAQNEATAYITLDLLESGSPFVERQDAA